MHLVKRPIHETLALAKTQGAAGLLGIRLDHGCGPKASVRL